MPTVLITNFALGFLFIGWADRDSLGGVYMIVSSLESWMLVAAGSCLDGTSGILCGTGVISFLLILVF